MENRLCTQSKFEAIDLDISNFDRWLTFDAINSRGLPLSQFDKIKNLCVLIADKEISRLILLKFGITLKQRNMVLVKVKKKLLL